jgi:tetratricopeptide (TPR) repeat protein
MSTARRDGSTSAHTLKILGLVALCGACALGGCGSHGRYTREHISAAKVKMDAMKAATEFEMGRSAFLAGDLEKALRSVNNSIMLNPQVARSHVMRGRILLEQGAMDEAMDALRRAESVDPASHDAKYYLGIAHERILDRAAALTYYRAAAELDPANAQYAIATAEMMMETGDLAGAREFLESRGPTFRHHAGVRQTLGHTALLQGDRARAAEMFNEARLLAPDDTQIAEDLARVLIDLGDFAQADIHLSRLLREAAEAPATENTRITRADGRPVKREPAPTRRDLLALRALCLAKLDRPVEARDLLLQLTRPPEGDNDVNAWIALGEVSFVLRDQSRLRQSASRVVGLAPQRPEGHTLRALAARSAGDLPAAVVAARRAAELRPDADTLTLLGLLQHESGDVDAARQTLGNAARLGGPDSPASRALAALPAPGTPAIATTPQDVR